MHALRSLACRTNPFKAQKMSCESETFFLRLGQRCQFLHKRKPGVKDSATVYTSDMIMPVQSMIIAIRSIRHRNMTEFPQF
jgi:hypothetical protein